MSIYQKNKMKQKKRKTTIEILDEMDKRNEYLEKLDKIREERNKLNLSPFSTNMKGKKNNNGKINQKN